MFLIFDTETTGLPQSFNAPLTDFDNWPRMVQISWQLHDALGQLIENKDYIIKPEGYDIPYKAYQIHGITTEKATKEGHDLATVLKEFDEALKKTKIVAGHNVEFDYSIVGSEFLRKGIKDELKSKPCIDTMRYGTNVCQLPGGRGGNFKPPKLTELYQKLYGSKFDEAHNSAADVNATAQVFFEMLRLDVYPLDKIYFTEEKLKAFKEHHPDPIPPFDIVIRNQVADSKKKKQSSFSEIDIDLGQYFNFYNHTIYSTLQATTHLSDLVQEAATHNFPAVGMVDLGNMMGGFKFIDEVEAYNHGLIEKQKRVQRIKENEATGIKNEEDDDPIDPKDFDEILSKKPLTPILGQEFYISDDYLKKQFTKENPDRRSRAVLLAKDFAGYKNLIKISSIGFTEGFYAGVARISRELIAEHKKDLIAVSGGIESEIPATILEFGEKRGEEVFKWWVDEFGEDFYVLLLNHHLDEEQYVNKVLLSFAKKYGVRVLAQNETYYTHQTDAKIQDIISCIKDGEKLSAPIGRGFGKRRSLNSDQYFLRNPDELKQTFNQHPEAFEAYAEFVSKFTAYELNRNVLLPKFEIPEQFRFKEDEEDGGKRGEMAYLRHLTLEGAQLKYGKITKEIQDRLDFELDIIEKTGYPGYFLIVQDFCVAATKMGVSVGPGRGSAAGSAVAYCIGITKIDPIKYDLLFERFLNPERVSMPDIDTDFDDHGRDRILKWVIQKYGMEQVAQIITYSVLGGKSAIKDAGRVLEYPISDTNNLAKLIPATPGMNLKKVVNNDLSKFRTEEIPLVEEVRKILKDPSDPRYPVLDAAYKMEGCVRGTGIHACGVVIAPEPVSSLVPVTIAAKDAEILVSQYDNSVAEHAGLLKMDFLGLRTLSIIRDALELIKKRHDIEVDEDAIPLDDAKTYQLFQEGRTIGIFQYESPGMQKYLRDLKPTVFADLIAMNALYRPGPIKYIPNFINRKHGLEEIVYDTPEMEEYLKETYGITVYQEQVMLLSQKLAGFTKGQADTLRKAMGKKKKKVLDQMYPMFISGGEKNGIAEEKLKKIWSDWEAFASYAFNKSHSTCYAYVAYHTAYLKAHYPSEFMASNLSNNINNTKQVAAFMEDCRGIGVDVLGPSVNESEYSFSVNEKEQIRFGLGAIKGIGEGPSEAICREREKGNYKNIFDFFERIPSSQINKRVVEGLVYAGAFDELDSLPRACYFAVDNQGTTNIEKLLKYGSAFQDNKSSIETSLFADMAGEVAIEKPKLTPAEEWQNLFKLEKEKEVIGLYLSAHPLDEFAYEFKFIRGVMSKESIFSSDEEEQSPKLEPEVTDKSESDDDPVDLPEAGEEEPEIEEVAEVSEPKGKFRFLNLDEIDAYKDFVLKRDYANAANLPKPKYGHDQNHSNGGTQYMIGGVIVEYMVQDGRKSGTQEAFVTLADYSGSYRLRLFDRDYMSFRDKLAKGRFIICKIRFSPSRDFDRMYVNVAEITEMKDVFEKYAEGLGLVVPYNMLNKGDLQFFSQTFEKQKGDKTLSFFIEDSSGKNFLELNSLQSKIVIDDGLLRTLEDYQKYRIFLN